MKKKHKRKNKNFLDTVAAFKLKFPFLVPTVKRYIPNGVDCIRVMYNDGKEENIFDNSKFWSLQPVRRGR